MKAEAMLIGQVETLWVVFFNPPHFIEFTFKQGQKSDLQVERKGSSGGIDPWFPEVT